MNFLRGFSLNAGSTLLVYLLGFLNQALLARFLSTEDYADLAYWSTTILFGALLCGEWLHRGSTYVVGREQARDQVTSSALVYSLGLGGVVIAAALLNRLLPGEGRLPVEWLLVAGLIVLQTAQKAGLGIVLGEDRLKLYALVPLIPICAYLGGNLLVLLLGGLSIEPVLWIWLLATGLSATVAFAPLLREGFRFRGVASAFFKRTLQVGGRGAVSFTLIFLMFRSNIWLLDWLMDAEHVATFRVSLNFAEMMQRLPNVAGVVLLAKVVRGHDEEGRLSLAVARGVLVFSMAAALGFLLLGRFFIDLFFPAYPDAYVPMVWMLPGLVCSGFGSVLNTKLAGQGYPPVTLWAPGLALAANVGLNLWLIPVLGLRGVALAASATYTLWALVVTVAYLRRTGLGGSAFLRPRASEPTIEKTASSDDSHDRD